ncbi:MAG TPA: hypothetical protein DEU95_11970 [Chloroflexi bacterium]|nr:hypothetical protein [Chloroflexota bacterium]
MTAAAAVGFSSASRIAIASGYRSSGDFARLFRITASSATGIDRLIVRGGGGSSFTCRYITWTGLSPGNGRRPVSIS